MRLIQIDKNNLIDVDKIVRVERNPENGILFIYFVSSSVYDDEIRVKDATLVYGGNEAKRVWEMMHDNIDLSEEEMLDRYFKVYGEKKGNLKPAYDPHNKGDM